MVGKDVTLEADNSRSSFVECITEGLVCSVYLSLFSTCMQNIIAHLTELSNRFAQSRQYINKPGKTFT
jgi:hypothetical protein